jgi:hypothetical protein
MPETHHPCGALPVVGMTINVWYCVHHQAWFASSSAYRQRSDEDIEFVGEPRRVEFGPFDDRADLEAWMAAAWIVLLNDTVQARAGG